MRRRFLVIHNPEAGRHHPGRLKAVIELLQARGCEVDLRAAESDEANRKTARAAVSEGGYEAVVAAGGDGTIRATASALIDTGMPLGIIPIGTGNVMAHEIGLRLDASAVAHCLIEGRTAPVQTGRANGQPFVLMVGAGFDGRVANWLDIPYKRRVGRIAYAWPMLRALAKGPDRLTVTVDGVAHEAAWTVATLRRRYAGRFLLAPQAQLHDQAVHAVLFKARGRMSLLTQLMEVAAGRIEQRPDVEHLSGARIEIRSDEPVPVQIDGEPFGFTPVEIVTAGPALHLILPPS